MISWFYISATASNVRKFNLQTYNSLKLGWVFEDPNQKSSANFLKNALNCLYFPMQTQACAREQCSQIRASFDTYIMLKNEALHWWLFVSI